MTSDYGFYFDDAGLSRPRGISSAEEELFSSYGAADATVRELAQNSMDAKSATATGPVRMTFELCTIQTKQIPDYENLRRHIHSADECNRNDEQNNRLRIAAADIDNDTIRVLRVGDYNTTGLTGKEGKTENSVLTALTYGSGISVGKVGAGGSFGIGKAAGLRASSIRTEFWVTRTEEKGSESIFTGYCQLATHLDPNDPNKTVLPDGIFTDRSRPTDLHYQRGRSHIEGFPPRTEPGTDVYVIGYRDEDPKLENIRKSLISNFMVAIARGHLTATGKSNGKTVWTLDSGTLQKYLFDDEQRAFYDALQEEPIGIHDPDLGDIKLYLNVNNTLPKKYDTIVMRSPLMKVTKWRHTSITTHYAAILECSDEKGNALLRRMEPVSHDDWDPRKVQEGKQIIGRLKKTIREELRKRIEKTVGDEITIQELNRLLPQGLTPEGPIKFKIRNGIPEATDTEDDDDEETATVHGKSAEEQTAATLKPKAVPITLYYPAVARDEGDALLKGRNRGGAGQRKSHDAGISGQGQAGDGNSLIQGAKITMKALYQGKGVYLLTLRARDNQTISGRLRLTATLEGMVDTDFRLPIISADDVSSDTPQRLPVSNSSIGMVRIRGTKPTKLKVTIQNKRKMQLAVI